MPANPDTIYILARRVLLDALDALDAHLNAITLVGAQAIYLRTGEADLAVSPYTTDGDLLLDPRVLQSQPRLEEAMRRAGFIPDQGQPGIWVAASEVTIDLLVAEAQGGPGRRGARLGPHGNSAARKARGLEAALVDRSLMEVQALDAIDRRSVRVAVAGPGALLVAKLHKLADRESSPSRREDKDALDILRLLRAISTQRLSALIGMLREDSLAGEVTREAVVHLEILFARPESTGSKMAAQAASPLAAPAETALACSLLTQDLLRAIQQS